ncbi:MAG: hypothetical protein H7175_25800, partial [Burkholderiales bacterium]|nr:hypothetical protein [Anaerolineae bacterium]
VAAKVEWDDEEHTILRVDLLSYTWPEYHEAIQQVVTEAGQQSHRVDVIIHNPSDPAPGNPLPHLRSSIRQIAAVTNIRMIVTIPSRRLPGFIRALADTVLHGYGANSNQQAIFVNSLAEARRRINEDRGKSAKA